MTVGFFRVGGDALAFSRPSILSHTGESTMLGTMGFGDGWVTASSQAAGQLRELVVPTDTMMQSRATGKAHKEEFRELLKSYGKGHALEKFMEDELKIPERLIKDRWQSS